MGEDRGHFQDHGILLIGSMPIFDVELVKDPIRFPFSIFIGTFSNNGPPCAKHVQVGLYNQSPLEIVGAGKVKDLVDIGGIDLGGYNKKGIDLEQKGISKISAKKEKQRRKGQRFMHCNALRALDWWDIVFPYVQDLITYVQA